MRRHRAMPSVRLCSTDGKGDVIMAYKHNEVMCGHCKTVFRPERAGRKYCSTTCARRGRKAKMVTLTCNNCHDTYTIREGYNHVRRAYCSIPCYKQARKENRREYRSPLAGVSSHDTALARMLRAPSIGG